MSTPIGIEVIRRTLAELPATPGVYRMFDAQGNALYIGKAKNLMARVAAYTKFDAMTVRIRRMVEQTSRMEVTTTGSEAEALLLESSLIRAMQPRFNVALKDDKSYPYIQLSGDHAYPRIAKYRGPKTNSGDFFGPFVSAAAVDETITLLQRAFLLRPCSDNVFRGRTRPCLQFQIKRCSAPCVKNISEEDYAGLVNQAKAFLKGKSRQIQDDLGVQMEQASQKMDFETAARLRDRIRALTQVQQQQGIIAESLSEADLIVLAREGEAACVQVYCYRGGRNYGIKSYFPLHTAQVPDSEVLMSFLGQFYQTQLPPAEIVVSRMLEEAGVLEDALAIRAGAKVNIRYPLKGDRKQAVTRALRNAADALQRHLSERATQSELLDEVATLFGLGEAPQRIEVYDNSHIMGAMAVGAMIVAGPDGFDKKSYRRFGMKNEELQPGDDYAMMREVLMRRFTRLQEAENEGQPVVRPDLVLIDGGAGHMTTVAELFEQMGIDIPFVCIAKGPDRNAGREWFHMPGRKPFQLLPDTPVLHYLQRLRDEAHRFAIGFHRNKRAKAIRASELDAIPAIGMQRKQALLKFFGSVAAVSGASVENIMEVPGINKATAQKIYRHFHGG